MVSYIPNILQEYMTSRTQIIAANDSLSAAVGRVSLTQKRITLGESLHVQWQQDALQMEWDDHSLRFSPIYHANDAADIAFCTGDSGIWLNTDEGMRALSADQRFITFQNGKWHIED